MESGTNYISRVAKELNLSDGKVRATVSLLEDGATVPFIARYRKEATGSIDEVEITGIRDRLTQLRVLDKRREAIFASLDERGLMTEELRDKLMAVQTMTELEDIYLPYRPKRRTRATVAREKGLEPLADILLEQDNRDPETEALAFVDPDKGVDNVEEALAGARDIIAELVSEHQEAREKMRHLYAIKGMFRTKVITGKEEEGSKYRDYFDLEEPVANAPSHRILAMRRGEKENVLTLRVIPPEDETLGVLESLFVKGGTPASLEVKTAVHDGFKRLLAPSIETEIRKETKKRADDESIKVFADNLRQLLLASPLGRKNVMAVDPGYRTGCKVCCLDSQGKLLLNDTIFPHQSEKLAEQSKNTVIDLCKRFNVEVIAVGNGTAGRETGAFLRSIDLPGNPPVVMVNESGASIYSASEAAREEFPDYDVTVRGTVSIGRRLMDPLAELVKIDPKSIGVGQYQHDVDQAMLKDNLDDVVISCVNSVGVDLNTASRQLLTYVSGLGSSLAKTIVLFRDEQGPFRSREELMQVPRLGDKAFEQAAGFLRIMDGDNPLDASAVHPESYHVVESIAYDCNCSVLDLLRKESLREQVEVSRYVTQTVGLPTLNDIMTELAKPGRDPRSVFELFSFTEGIHSITDLKPGMKVAGIVTNITAFGAFVDIGVHQDGLVHISQLADRFVRNPADVVKVHQKVNVTVLEVDVDRKRISLSLRNTQADNS
ncbi:Tex family protein [Candidatus Latescibacterota bacterium]